jgi:hypothetical protein
MISENGMTTLDPLPDGIVIHCPDCDATLLADPRQRLEHHDDGSHSVYPWRWLSDRAVGVLLPRGYVARHRAEETP